MSLQFGTLCLADNAVLLPILGYLNLVFSLLISLYSVNYTHLVFSIWQYVSGYIVPCLALFAVMLLFKLKQKMQTTTKSLKLNAYGEDGCGTGSHQMEVERAVKNI